jgi:hypothetical protein
MHLDTASQQCHAGKVEYAETLLCAGALGAMQVQHCDEAGVLGHVVRYCILYAVSPHHQAHIRQGPGHLQALDAYSTFRFSGLGLSTSALLDGGV